MIITDVIDEKLCQMRRGEKTMIVLRSTSSPPKKVAEFLQDCREFYICYVIDLRMGHSKTQARKNTMFQQKTQFVSGWMKEI